MYRIMKIDYEMMKQVMNPEIVEMFRLEAMANRNGMQDYSMQILERWCRTYPEVMEEMSATKLMMTLIPQQDMEIEVLESNQAQEQMRNGITPSEILRMHEIDPYQTLIRYGFLKVAN